MYRIFLILCVFHEAIHPTLHTLFTNFIWKRKLSFETLKAYIFRQRYPPSNKQYIKRFNEGQRKKILQNSKCDEFDICLYYDAIKITFKYNADLRSKPALRKKLIYWMNAVKKIRNDIFHDNLDKPLTVSSKYVEDLKLAMNKILTYSGDIFGDIAADDAKIQIIEVNKNINKIMTYY